MTVAEKILRISAGSGLHACILLILPFSVNRDLAPVEVFAIFFLAYLVFVLLNASIGAVELTLSKKKESSGDEGGLRPPVLASAVFLALLYAALPASLVLSWGITAEIMLVSLVAFALGFFLQWVCVKVAFARSSGKIILSFFLAIPVFLISVLSAVAAQ
ncbi:hypothetical protein [Nocardiopsis sp. MG754419]|uniref:hypothetical protein n=1 Tax=Nocardiopsis sp. MG754419 TaxID=2259865 RepID=UPI001BA4B7E1|nr:hypothetical protein [Nocardiopsis sp. MG754419]MBR8744776.1 hypothetical protein [Nocardiopsis sp. MG754419]